MPPFLTLSTLLFSEDRSSGVTVTGYVNVTVGDEAALMDALVSSGPISVAIDASHESFRFYTQGVYFEPTCKNDVNSLDHGTRQSPLALRINSLLAKLSGS